MATGRRRTLGTEIAQEIRSGPGEPAGLTRFLRDALRRYDALPKGLCHREADAHHSGRRTATGELLYFDIECVGIEPRFLDVAQWYGEPPPGKPPRGFAARYLEHYARAGGDPVPLCVFEAEALRQLLAHQRRGLPDDGAPSTGPPPSA